MWVNPLAVAFAILSVPSAGSLLLAGGVVWRLSTRSADTPSRTFLAAVAAIEVPLFFMSGGATLFDPYALGYRGLAVPALLALLVLVGWASRALDVAVWGGLAALLYLVDAYDSRNLWDYLVDPVAGLAAIVWLAVAAVRKRKQSRAKRDATA